jgi:hypothetical protein
MGYITSDFLYAQSLLDLTNNYFFSKQCITSFSRSAVIPAVEAIVWAEWLTSSMVRILFFRAGERDLIMMVVGNKEVCKLF